MSAITASREAEVPHIAQVPLVPIRELLRDSQNGLSKRQGDAGEAVPVLRLANIVDGAIDESDARDIRLTSKEIAKYVLQPGDLLCIRVNGSRNLVGRVVPFTAQRRWAYCDHFIRLRPNQTSVNSRYLAHYLNTRVARRQIELNMVSSAGQNTVSQGTMLDLSVPLPDLATQRAIVAEIEKQFSRLDEAVATLNRVKANLQRQTAAVLSVAVSGLLFERYQQQSSTDRPEIAPLVELPARWSWASIAHVCEVVASGSTPKPEEMTTGHGEVPFIKVYNLGFDGSLDFTVKPTFIRRAIHEGQLGRSRCLPGDVLMNIVGPPLGKVSLVTNEYPEWNINQAIVTFRTGPRLLNRLLTYWLMSPPVQRRIEKTSKATAGQFNVQVTTCRKLVLPLPPLEEQKRIVAEVDRRLSIVREVEREVEVNLKHAQALRRAVLQRAFCVEGRERDNGPCEGDPP